MSELVTRWTKKEVLKKLEHYQNEFVLHQGIIDTMREDIEEHETSIAGHSQNGKDMMNVVLVKKHLDFRERMDTQIQIYVDLKKKFFRFLTKYM